MSPAGLILASASPRRLALLAQCGIVPARVAAPDIDETPLPREKPLAYVARIARAKAEAVSQTAPNDFVLAADTTVFCGQRILGKAENREEAQAFLSLLSGRRHRVATSVCLIAPGQKKVKTLTVTTLIKFKRLSAQDIETYLSSNDWVGKAGAYGIQGSAGAFVSFISGSYTGVVGLPLYETVAALKGAGYVQAV